MAGKIGIARHTSPIATGTAVKTLLQVIAAADHPIRIIQCGFGGYGVNNTHAPIYVYLARQSDAGTMSALTIAGFNDSDGDTFDTDGTHTSTGEPTTGALLPIFTVHPQSQFVWSPPSDARITVGAGDRIGLICNAGTGVNCEPFIIFEE